MPKNFGILFKNQVRTRFLMGNAPDFLDRIRNRVRVILKYGEDTNFGSIETTASNRLNYGETVSHERLLVSSDARECIISR